jgi:adenylate cyclase
VAVAATMAAITYPILTLIAAAMQHELETRDLVGAAAMSALFGGLFAAYELFIVEGRPGRWIRRTHFATRLGISLAVYILIMMVIGGVYEAVMYPGSGPSSYMGFTVENRSAAFIGDLLGGLAMFLMVFLIFALRRVVDGPTLVNLLSGRYRQAVRGERIFLFLDLADSTAMSEKLGEVGAYGLISRVFFDVDEVILDHAGTPERYVGDEIVVTWTIDKGTEQANCIRCVFGIHALMRERADRYQDLVGWRPEFRAGLHCGPIAIGECGDSRREIQYFGDTINATARIQTRCRELNENFLISDELLNRVELPAQFEARDLGEYQLRGRSGLIRLYGMTLNDG